MPTYVCAAPPGLLSNARKAAIAQAISCIHSNATGAPTYFVQVVFDEPAAGNRYLGGEPADAHIWIRADIRTGRPEAVRKAMALQMMRETAVIAGIEQRDVWVYICNLAPTDMIEYGQVLPPPGEEKAWFEELPPDLQAFLTKAASRDRASTDEETTKAAPAV